MNNENRTQVVSLRRMFFAVFYQWKKVLAVVLTLAVLLGGLRGLRSWQSIDQAGYQAALESYVQENAWLEQRIADIQREVAYHREYLEKSVLMQLDYYKIQEAKVSLYISAEQQETAEPPERSVDERGTILNIYHAALTGDKVLENVAGAVDMETKYLKELVRISSSQERILSIYVWHTDLQIAQQIRELLLEQLQTVGQQITDAMGEHTLHAVTDSAGSVAASEVAEQQTAALQRLKESEEKLAGVEVQRNALVKPADPGAAAGKNAAKTAVIWAVLGGMLGAVLAALVICCDFVCGDRVYSAEELRCRFGIRNIGGIWSGKKKCDPVSAKLMAAEGRVSCNTLENLDLIAANIGSFAEAGGTVLLVGALGQASLAANLQQRLPDVKLIACGSLLTDAAAVRALSGCNGVILVTQRGVSRYGEVSREIERINDAEKTLIGCIMEEK